MNYLPSRRAACFAVLTITTLWLGACAKPAPAPEPVRAVKLITVGVAPLASTIGYSGEVRARSEAKLGFRVGGKLLQRSVDLGQRVRAGQELARLDGADLQLGVDAARAQVSAARTNRELADADHQRYLTLRQQNFISAAELQRRRATLDAAQAQLEAAQAQLATQSNQARYSTLRADAAGVVTAVLAEPGQVLGAGAAVVQVALDGARDVVFAVPEDKVDAIHAGRPVRVQVWPDGAAISAVVREVAASADPVTRTYTVKAALPANTALALGRTVTVQPQGVQRVGQPAITVPTSALLQQGDATVVWLFDPASLTVRAQAVEVASADGNDVVVRAGLQPGMQVVSAGVHVLRAGQKVTIYKEKQALAQENQAQEASKTVAAMARPASAAQ